MLGLVHRYVMACGAVYGIRAMIDTMMQRWRKLGVAGQTSERRGMLESFITTPIWVKSLFRSLKGIADGSMIHHIQQGTGNVKKGRTMQ